MQIGNHAMFVLRTASQSRFSADRAVTIELSSINPRRPGAALCCSTGDHGPDRVHLPSF